MKLITTEQASEITGKSISSLFHYEEKPGFLTCATVARILRGDDGRDPSYISSPEEDYGTSAYDYFLGKPAEVYPGDLCYAYNTNFGQCVKVTYVRPSNDLAYPHVCCDEDFNEDNYRHIRRMKK